jgi:hypothetical protein
MNVCKNVLRERVRELSADPKCLQRRRAKKQDGLEKGKAEMARSLR